MRGLLRSIVHRIDRRDFEDFGYPAEPAASGSDRRHPSIQINDPRIATG